MEKLNDVKANYSGYLCFINNTTDISTCEKALDKYILRDYVEKDFDEMKHDLGMNRPKVQDDDKLEARLFIIFIAEMYTRQLKNLKHTVGELRTISFNTIVKAILGFA
jgi:hypothetical protein